MRDQETLEKISYFLRDDEHAIDLALMYIHIADVWDDLIDLDQEVGGETINQMMWMALSGIPRNPFFRRFHDELLPIVEVAICNWVASDVLRSDIDNQKAQEIANVIRHGLSDLLIHMARLIGGPSWAMCVAPAIKLLAQNDTLTEFVKE
jgi:hypothetical protein